MLCSLLHKCVLTVTLCISHKDEIFVLIWGQTATSAWSVQIRCECMELVEHMWSSEFIAERPLGFMTATIKMEIFFLTYERFSSLCHRRRGCRNTYRGHQFQLLAVAAFCLQQLHSRQVVLFLPALPLFLDTGVSSGTRPGRGKTHAHRKDRDTVGRKKTGGKLE